MPILNSSNTLTAMNSLPLKTTGIVTADGGGDRQECCVHDGFMTQLTLYSRPDCHLCDDAAALLQEVAPEVGVNKVDIEGDIQLLSRYGLRVPVLLRNSDSAELGWPFDAASLAAFLETV
jgi:hypothetical protein